MAKARTATGYVNKLPMVTALFWVIKIVAAGWLGGFLLLASPNPASADSHLPNRYHCDYNGHGYHRCDGGYPNEHNPGQDNYRPPSNSSDCPRPHRHTGYPYGSDCDQQHDDMPRPTAE